MNSNYIESTSQIHQQEHDGEDTGTRKVLLYGWDYTNLVKRRVAVNASGELIIEGGVIPANEGVGYWVVGTDFVVS